MFETAELDLKLSKSEFARQEPETRTELLQLQRDLNRLRIPAIVLIHGMDGSGRGDVLNRLHEWLDARYLLVYAPGDPSEEESQRPEYWRHWMHLPARGQIGLCLGSWYSPAMAARAYGAWSDDRLDAAMARARRFEQALVDDGMLVIKLWLHLTKKQQKRRFRRIEGTPHPRWPVTQTDWKHHALYGEFRKVASRVIRTTSTAGAPWTVIEAGDWRYRDIAVVKHLIQRVRQRVSEAERATGAGASSAAREDADQDSPSVPTWSGRTDAFTERTILDTLDLGLALNRQTYEERLAAGQARLNRLAHKVARKPLGVVVVFQGWDAAGKGGAIRRVAQALDARDCRIVPVAAPTDEERAHHYLWRFWRHLPRLGKTTLFDRSWYGRVLVERVERYATTAEWQRAFHEINDFEEQLVGFGIVVVKFWLHISKDEQLRRFQQRESTPWKRHKITEEDYRNRERWSDYEVAVSEMIGHTSTEYAPWTLVEGNDKPFARVKVLETLCGAVEKALAAHASR